MKKAVKSETLKAKSFFNLQPFTFNLLPFMIVFSFAMAQSPQEAIDFVSGQPAFSQGLADRPGWTANAYFAHERYGLWHIEFYDADGNYLGWADANLEQQKLYAWESMYDPIERENAEAETVLIDFLRNDPLSLQLIGNVDDSYGWWFDYDGWRDVWQVHLDRGEDSVDITLRSSTNNAKSFENLYLDKVFANSILSYDDWLNANTSGVVAIAFEHPEVAAAVRGQDWTTSTERLEGEAWKVRFLSGEEVIVEADVNRADGSVANVAIMQ
ncbi:MAG: hypothetical protein ACRCYY_03085 [Trueperaceae bacterium]